jgi:hypothetical protein
MSRSGQFKDFADELFMDRLDHFSVLIPRIRRRWRRYKIHRRMRRRIREAEIANKTRIGPKKRAKWFCRPRFKINVDCENACEDTDDPVPPEVGILDETPILLSTDNLQHEESHFPHVPRGATPSQSEPSGNDLFGVAVVAEFIPGSVSVVDIHSATPAPTHSNTYCKDRPGSTMYRHDISMPQRNSPCEGAFLGERSADSTASETTGSGNIPTDASHVCIKLTPTTPPSFIPSMQNVQPTLSYTAPTSVEYLEVPKALKVSDRQKSEILVGGSGHNESASPPGPPSATPTAVEHQDMPKYSRFSHPKSRYSESTRPTADKSKSIARSGIFTISPTEKHFKGAIPLNDNSACTKKISHPNARVIAPTMGNLMIAQKHPASRVPYLNHKHDQGIKGLADRSAHVKGNPRSKTRSPIPKLPEVPHSSSVSHPKVKRPQATSTGMKNGQKIEDLVTSPWNIHKAVFHPQSFRARQERNGSPLSSDTEPCIQPFILPYPDSPSRNQEVSYPQDLLDKLRNGALTRKAVPYPQISRFATKNSSQQQTSHPVSSQRGRTEHHARFQALELYSREGPYTARQAEETPLPDANSTVAPRQNVSTRNLSTYRHQTPLEISGGRIVMDTQAEHTALPHETQTEPLTQVQSSPHRVLPRSFTVGVPEPSLPNNVRPEDLAAVLDAGHQTQRRRWDAHPVDNLQQAPMYEAFVQAGLAARARRVRHPDASPADVGSMHPTRSANPTTRDL